MRSKTPTKKRVVTSKDVAAYAKVSQPTVSRVFSNPSCVKPQTVDHVMAVAKALGYTPNAIARSLNNRQTDMIAVVDVNVANPFYQMLLLEVSALVRSLGKQMIYIQSSVEQSLDHILDRVLQYQVDGVIILAAAISSEMKNRFLQVDIPLVIFNKTFDSQSFFSVCTDNVNLGEMVAQHLVEKGYTSFGYISGDMLRQTSENRFLGFSNQLALHGKSVQITENGDYTYISGWEAMSRIAQHEPLPNAIFCANDLMAFGAMDFVRKKLQLSIPKDIAFVGVDNLEQSQWSAYQLTSVNQPVEAMIAHTLEYFQKRFAQTAVNDKSVLLKCSIEERSSTLGDKN